MIDSSKMLPQTNRHYGETNWIRFGGSIGSSNQTTEPLSTPRIRVAFAAPRESLVIRVHRVCERRGDVRRCEHVQGTGRGGMKKNAFLD